MAAFASLGPAEATMAITAEGWTAKDVIGHLIHWGGLVAFALGAPLTPPPYLAAVTGRPSGEEWNRLAVAFYQDLELEQVVAELDRTVEALVDAVRRKSDADMIATDAMPWAGGGPLWQKIAGDTFAHWPAHRADLERVARQLRV